MSFDSRLNYALYRRKESDNSEKDLEDRGNRDMQASGHAKVSGLVACVSKESSCGGIVRIVSDATKWRRINNVTLQPWYNHRLLYPPTLLRQNFGLPDRTVQTSHLNVVFPPFFRADGFGAPSSTINPYEDPRTCKGMFCQCRFRV